MLLSWNKCITVVGAAVFSLAAAAQQGPKVELPPQALANPQLLIDGYTKNCETGSVTLPAPHGDADIKDSPKLHAYCQCFATKFANRAVSLSKAAQRPPATELLAGERDMRNSCRQEQGLATLDFPPLRSTK